MLYEFYIYGIFNNSTHELVYVGYTQCDIQYRLKQHKSTTLKNLQGEFYIEALESGIVSRLDHENFWINYTKFLGCNLMNKLTEYPKKKRIAKGLKMNLAELI